MSETWGCAPPSPVCRRNNVLDFFLTFWWNPLNLSNRFDGRCSCQVSLKRAPGASVNTCSHGGVCVQITPVRTLQRCQSEVFVKTAMSRSEEQSQTSSGTTARRTVCPSCPADTRTSSTSVSTRWVHGLCAAGFAQSLALPTYYCR